MSQQNKFKKRGGGGRGGGRGGGNGGNGKFNATPKGQIKSEWIYKDIHFPNQQLKNLKNFCPEGFEVEYL